MKRIILVALCAALVPIEGQNNIDTYRLCGKFNGRYWNQIASLEGRRQAYLEGVMDALAEYNRAPQEQLWPNGATDWEVEKSLNRFYRDPANLQIPILDAIYVVKLRFEGNDTKRIDDATRQARTTAISFVSNCSK